MGFISIEETIKSEILSDDFDIYRNVVTPDSLNSYSVRFTLKYNNREADHEDLVNDICEKIKETKLFKDSIQRNEDLFLSSIKAKDEYINQLEIELGGMQKYKNYYDLHYDLKHGQNKDIYK